MGRPKISEHRKRHRRVQFLLRPGEYRAWATAARGVDLTLSEFIRMMVVRGMTAADRGMAVVDR